MRYNLKFRKLTFYGLTRPQSIRKQKQISRQTILSSPQDLEFNPNFTKNRDILVVKQNSVTRPVTPEVLTPRDRYTLNILFNIDHMPNSSIQSILHLSIHLFYLQESFCFDTIYSAELPKVGFFERRRQDVDDRSPTKTNFKQVQWCVLLI